jgi:hypothetical protein
MKRLRVRTDPLLPAVRTTYRGSVDHDLVVLAVLVILSAVWAMVQWFRWPWSRQESVVVNPARVAIRLTPACWRFVYDARSWPVRIRLPVDVQAGLDDIPPLEVSGAVPEPRIVVTMTRPHAEALERWLHALHDDLQYDDDRRLTCLLCISGIAMAIMFS